jgi:sporulation protein YlmC with PRC-barrel domain
VVPITIEIISNRLKTVADLINSRSLQNIVVISRSGEIVGRVKSLRMKGFNVEGIVIAKPFSISKEFIDRAFIKTFDQNQILLKINPVTSLKGLKVYDMSGRKLGKVIKVLRQSNTNNFTGLVIKNRFFSRPILVEKEKIDIMKKNVILNIDYDEYSNEIKRKELKESLRKK